MEVIRPHRYLVSLPEGATELHGEDLKPYYPPTGKNGVPYHFYVPDAAPPEKDTFTLEKIVDHRLDKRSGKLQWRCRWKGYPPEEDTWQFAEDFVQGIQKDWVTYNRQKGIQINLKDLKVKT